MFNVKQISISIADKLLLFGFLFTCLFVFEIHHEAFAFENVKFVNDITSGLSKPVDVTVSKSGEIYVVDENNDIVSIYGNNGDFIKFFGELGEEEGQFKRPRSVTISNKGKLIVADTGNNRIQVFDRVGKYLFKFGGSGAEPGQFREPSSVVVDQFGLIYVADKGNRRVQVFSPNGIFLSYFNVEFRPVDLGIDSKRNLYVLMPEKGKIVKYSPQGKKLQDIDCDIDGRNFILKAVGIEVDEKGDIYITESAEHSIKKFDNNEKILISFGSHGGGRGQFDFAEGIASDESGQIYIADSKNARVQILKISGNSKPAIISEEKTPLILDYYSAVRSKEGVVDIYSIPGKGFYALSDQEKHLFVSTDQGSQFGIRGVNPGEFNKPKAIAVTLTGKMFIADSGNNRVQILNEDNVSSYQFGNLGKKAGQFSKPKGIAINSKGEVYVADTNNNRIQIFTFDGIYLKTISKVAVSDREFEAESFDLRAPVALSINSKDEIYLIDSVNNRVLLINENGKLLRVVENNEEGLNKFIKLVDIAVDANDNLYVADQGNYRIQIFDHNGKLVEAFGSIGEGSGYFRKISAITASEGKIYVADYLDDHVQVFRFLSWGFKRKERFYASKTGQPPQDHEGNEVLKYSIAKRHALDEAIEEFREYLHLSKEEIRDLIRIEAIEVMNDKRVQVTVSILKNVPGEMDSSSKSQ